MISLGRALDASEMGALKETFSHEAIPVFLSDVAFKPGLLEKLNQIEQVGIPDNDPLLSSFIPAKELLGFTSQTGILWSEHIEDLLYRKAMYGDLIAQKGILREIMDRMKGIRQVGNPEVRDINVPIAEIHCPRVHGCKTVFTLSSKDTSDYSFKMTILGFGGGTGESVSFGRTAEITAEGACLKYWVPVTIEISQCEKDKISFNRVDIIEIKNGHLVTQISENDDHCRKISRIAEVMELHPEHYYYDAEGVFSGEIEIGANKKLDWEWGLTIPLSKAIGTEISLEGSVESLKTITYRYELVGKHHYVGYDAPGSLGYCWEWERI